MRMDSTLNMMPEGSLGDLPTAVGGIEETREGTHPFLRRNHKMGAPLITS